MLVTAVETIVTAGPTVGGRVLTINNPPGTQLDVPTDEANRLRQLRAAYAELSDLNRPAKQWQGPPDGGHATIGLTTEPGVYYLPAGVPRA